MSSRARYFIPVCLYPHTKYRTQQGVSDLLEKFELRSSDYLMVVADELLVLDRLVSGRFWTVDSARIKARREAEQVLRLLKRTASKAGATEGATIVYWEAIADTHQFSEFSSRLRPHVVDDPVVGPELTAFAEQRVKRFGLGSNRDQELMYEREYLLSEVCMSIYCTEILSFTTEIWERPPGPDVPDILKLLYLKRPEVVATALGKPVRRTLRFLYEDTHEGIDKSTNELASPRK